jgi:hypothetical protein
MVYFSFLIRCIKVDTQGTSYLKVGKKEVVKCKGRGAIIQRDAYG